MIYLDNKHGNVTICIQYMWPITWPYDSFNRPVLQIIHDLMTRQHTICINTTIFHAIITNSMRTRGAKYSHPVLITRLCRTFLPDVVFDSYDRVFVAQEWATSAFAFMQSGPLVSSLKMPQPSPLQRNFWRMMMTWPFSSRTPQLIHEPLVYHLARHEENL